MNTIAASTSGVNVALGGISALLVIGVLTGLAQNLGLSARGAFWLLFVIGVTMCARGPLGQGAEFGWWNPGHIVGYVLGGLALVLAAAVLFDWSLPLINGPRAAVLALALVMAVKMLIALLYPRLG